MKIKYLLCSCILLASCDLDDLFKPSTPDCHNKDTVGLVKQIVNDSFKQLGVNNMFDIQVNPKYELSYSKDTGTRTCSATLKVNVSKKASKADREGLNALLSLYGNESEIKYTVTIVKDNNGDYNQYVQMIE